VQVFGNDFFQRQGEVRFARTLELPANRGRVLDRNGLILATSVVAQSVWADSRRRGPRRPQAGADGQAAGDALAELKRRLADRQDLRLGQAPGRRAGGLKVKELGIKGMHLRKEYKRQYPEGEAAAHVVGFTNVEDLGQEGVELAFNQQLSGKPGSRRVIKDRWAAWSRTCARRFRRSTARTCSCRSTARSSSSPTRSCATRCRAQGQGGSVVVLDALTGEVLALANYPSYNPNKRRNLTGEQLRNRALTDSFEPGSTMKPFIAALALEKGWSRPETRSRPRRAAAMGGFTISDVHAYDVLTVNEVIQKSSNVGTVKMAMQMQPRDMWEAYTQVGFGQKPQLPFPGAVSGRLRAYKTWRRSSRPP
jgi:cell division protein FtsI (penicillin-binding protein 3)